MQKNATPFQEEEGPLEADPGKEEIEM
ncbi:hypothetical protein EYZ11_008542 [Aspergillus tanneri]|uniref:Uncharacterized protein n=1 Tax=Aspergillus tanneri TaxID=1220188 RepID=A0A4S3JA88_9EURO|nr:hypothetical protein EYZ11_008542 [Aspergillus tanneri]